MRRLLRWHLVNKLSPESSGQLKYTGAQLAALSSQLTGRIVVPQDNSYNSAREAFVKTFQHYPQLIVYAAGFSDVANSIKFAQQVGLYPVCRAGGHSTAGYSVNDDMVIDVTAINYVRVDPQKRQALVGAGALFAQIDTNLDFYGLHVPGGGCEIVGVAGYMQGGGYSFTSLLYGMNCDNVASVQIALADGRIVTADATQNDDLYWAVRGGTGNNFGVLLEVEYRLRELGTLWGFGFKWPIRNDPEAAAATEAVTTWQAAFTGSAAPPNLGQQALLIYTTANANTQKLDPYFVVRGMFNGTEADCRKALDPLFQLIPDESYRDIWCAGSYLYLNNYLLDYPSQMPDVPASVRSLAKSHIVDRHLSRQEWASIVDLYRAVPNSGTLIGIEAYGGAINQIAPDATAFWHRRAAADIFLYSFWLYDDQHAQAEAYVRQFDRVVGPLSNGHSYQNYPNRENQNFGQLYFGGNLARLKQVKQKYDPQDFFTFPQGISRA